MFNLTVFCRLTLLFLLSSLLYFWITSTNTFSRFSQQFYGFLLNANLLLWSFVFLFCNLPVVQNLTALAPICGGLTFSHLYVESWDLSRQIKGREVGISERLTSCKLDHELFSCSEDFLRFYGRLAAPFGTPLSRTSIVDRRHHHSGK